MKLNKQHSMIRYELLPVNAVSKFLLHVICKMFMIDYIIPLSLSKHVKSIKHI